MDLWQMSHAHQHRTALSKEAWRIVETQSISSTRKIVDSFIEHEILENEIEGHKPQFNCKGYHYLLATPFRYPPLKYGSRFGKNSEPSLWYGSIQLSTALAEIAYYGFVLLADSAMKEYNIPIPKTAFLSKIKTKNGLDLTKEPFLTYRQQISDPTQWGVSQQLGSQMRGNSIQAFIYFSARDPQESRMNVGAFTCMAFGQKKPKILKHFDQFRSINQIEFIDKETKETYVFKRDIFLVNGNFPYPLV